MKHRVRVLGVLAVTLSAGVGCGTPSPDADRPAATREAASADSSSIGSSAPLAPATELPTADSAPLGLASGSASAPIPSSPSAPRYPKSHGGPHEGHYQVVGATYSSDGALLITSGFSGDIIVWNVDSWTIRRRLPPTTLMDNGWLGLRSDGAVLTCGRDRALRAWPAIGLEPASQIELAPLTRDCLTASLDPKAGRIALTDGEVQVEVRDAQTGALQHTLRTGPIWGLALSPDGSRLALAGAKLTIWDPVSGEQTDTVPTNKKPQNVAWRPDGRELAVGVMDGTVVLLDTRDWREVRSLPLNRWGASRLAWTPDGEVLVGAGGVTGDATIKWWADQGWHEIGASKMGSVPEELLKSPDGATTVTVGHGGTVRFWDTHKAAQLAAVEAVREY